jgi:predicted N-formylglutamate amidohydrolase
MQVDRRASSAASAWSEAFSLHHADGAGGVVLICEHASNHIPDAYRGLGLRDDQRRMHIAWDPGALEVATELSRLLDAPLVHARYSRLLLDLNRAPGAADAIALSSEDIPIPGNHGIGAAEQELRRRRIYQPFHAAIDALIERRLRAGQATAVASIHSFTPVYRGQPRPWQVGVIAQHDRRLADGMLAALRRDPTLCVGDNQPYAPADGVYHTIERHGEARGLACVMLELRQDLLADAPAQRDWARRLEAGIRYALAALDTQHPPSAAASGTRR